MWLFLYILPIISSNIVYQYQQYYYRFTFAFSSAILVLMAERNNHVQFPELLGQADSLEALVVNMTHGKPLLSDHLPIHITTTNIEKYANWISQLTERDQNHAERGAVLHVRASNKAIIYPTNPDVGNENGCGWAVSKKRDKFIPTMDIHSHPVDACHSTSYGDMGTLISGWEEDEFIPTGILVATPRHNYLMLRTKETITEDRWTVYNKAYDAYDYEEFIRFRRFGSAFGKSVSIHDSDRFWPVLNHAEKNIFKMDFESYYRHFIESLNLSEMYHLGFYRSNKDGIYERFTRPKVIAHITESFNAALDTARNH